MELKSLSTVLIKVIKQLLRFIVFLSVSVAILYWYYGPEGRDNLRQTIKEQLIKPSGDVGTTYYPLYDRYWLSNVPYEVAEQLGIMEGDKILEVGCGTGTILAEVASRSVTAQATCIEQSPDMVRYAKKFNAKSVNSGVVKVMQGKAHMMPFQTESFDIVYSYNLVNLYQDEGTISAMLDEQWRVLRSGGLLAVCFRPDDTLDMRFLNWFASPFYQRSDDQWQDLVQKAGHGDIAKAKSDDYTCHLRMKNQIADQPSMPGTGHQADAY